MEIAYADNPNKDISMLLFEYCIVLDEYAEIQIIRTTQSRS